MFINSSKPQLFDVLGGCVRFLSSPEDTQSDHGFLQGVLPAGVIVPLHKHDDPESFYIVEGEMSFFCDDGAASGWRTVVAGDLAVIPGSIKHAWWNRSDARCMAIIITGPSLYDFFQKIAIPAPDDWIPGVPSPERFATVAEAASQSRTWLASPEENAAIGIPMLAGT